jgi:hypothetical protein
VLATQLATMIKEPANKATSTVGDPTGTIEPDRNALKSQNEIKAPMATAKA